MKTFFKNIPIILYPYIYLPVAVSYIFWLEKYEDKFTSISIWKILIIVCNVCALIFAIANIVRDIKGVNSVEQSMRGNLIVKCAHIPSYIFHIILFIIGVCMSIWGIPVLFFAALMLICTMVISGVNSIGCWVHICREGVISKIAAFFCIIGSFVCVADVVLAIVYYIKTRKNCSR